jgi:uncharacterized protein YPO0396
LRSPLRKADLDARSRSGRWEFAGASTLGRGSQRVKSDVWLARGPGHGQTIVDWEIAQLYRTLRDRGDAEADVLRKIKDKWLGRMCSANRDTAFFVGNQFRNPDGFLVLGVFWPPRG